MNKIKVFLVGTWFIAGSVGATPTPTMTLSATSSSNVGKDFLIITIVSSGLVFLEKLCEKIHSYCVARGNSNETSDIEIDNIEQADDNPERNRRTANQTINQELL